MREPSAVPARVILASASERRRELLGHLDVPFEVCVSYVDESRYSAEPARLVVELAAAKAAAVLKRVVERSSSGEIGEPWVLGADTVVALPELPGVAASTFGKPDGDDHAKEMLRALSGRLHLIHTGVALCRPERPVRVEVETTAVRFRELSDAVIDVYVATGEPRGKAGAYAIQGDGAQLIDGIEGCYYNVVGLPLTLAGELFAEVCGSGAVLCDCRAHPLQRGDPRCDATDRDAGAAGSSNPS